MAKPPRQTADSLDRYRAKRSASGTPEPFGGAAARPRLFVVQQHHARRMHFDLRLELHGVLRSWAVPKGPSFDPAEKRLAVEVEDHPVDYADFEGTIPEGNYGAGAVVVWDLGCWTPLEDPDAGFEHDKLLFTLHGYKLHGTWTLVRTRRKGQPTSREWLLIKKPDAWADAAHVARPESVLSGLTVEDVAAGRAPGPDAVRAAVVETEAPRWTTSLDAVEPMLAHTAAQPFSRDGWLFEIKYDGYRLLAERTADGSRLRYRRGEIVNARFPEIARGVASLPCASAVLDGELIVADDAGRPSFARLQQRVRLSRPDDVARAAVTDPATFFVFDLLAFEGNDLRRLPLRERKRLLQALLPPLGPLRYVEHVETDGEATFAAAVGLGLEGVMAKRADAPYRAGRHDTWLKFRGARTDDFTIVGFTRPAGRRTGLGALLLASGGERLVYAGRVGTGFDDAALASLRAMLEPLARTTPPCDAVPPRERHATWVEPLHVCEVRYTERTDDGLLRQPVFLRLRPDKAPTATSAAPAPAPPAPLAPAPPTVAETHRDKVFWPAEGYTKGDLLDYYRAVAPALLPYLRDRPLVMTRFPDGITGKSFFQKDAPEWAPDWIRTVRVWSEDSQRELDYFVCDDVESLLWIVNLGTIPLHVWASRVASLQRPDWCIIDLDPKTAPFTAVVELALAIHRLCDEIGLPNFAKTSGQAGLHVLIPLAGACTFAQAKELGELLARVIVTEHPSIATVARAVAGRGGRVYVDYLQNGHGKLLAAPLCVRPVPGATVSTPLAWSEVTKRLDPTRFTIRTVPRRLAQRRDPMAALLTTPSDLVAALAALADRNA